MKSSTDSGRLAGSSDVLVEAHAVVRIYPGVGGDVGALDGVSLRVKAGEFFVLTGRSGSGKTTFVNCMTGLDRCTSGEIYVGGTAVHRLTPESAARWRRRTVGVVFQGFELLPTLTAIENVMLPMDFAGTFPGRDKWHRGMELLEAVDIADHARKMPSALSGGQQQRLAIARAMANDPEILVADEPTGSLDSTTAESVLGLLESIVRRGKTVFLVTHDRDVAAHGSNGAMLEDGRISVRNTRIG